MKRTLISLISFLAVLALLLQLAGCGKEAVYSIDLGDGLPAWNFTEARYASKVTDAEKEAGVDAIYRTDTKKADVYVYRYEKASGETLESFGQKQAEKYDVFCNITEKNGAPAASFCHFDRKDDGDFLVNSIVFETETQFVMVCAMYKTEKVKLADTDLCIHMMREYTMSKPEETTFPYEIIYTPENNYLPTVKIRRFAKDYFNADTFDTSTLKDTTREKYLEYAEGGWTLEEELAFYADSYTMQKSEIIRRNGFDAAFMGYLDEGVMKVKAILDYGNEYIMICAEDSPEAYNHFVNALIDAIERPDA